MAATVDVTQLKADWQTQIVDHLKDQSVTNSSLEAFKAEVKDVFEAAGVPLTEAYNNVIGDLSWLEGANYKELNGVSNSTSDTFWAQMVDGMGSMIDAAEKEANTPPAAPPAPTVPTPSATSPTSYMAGNPLNTTYGVDVDGGTMVQSGMATRRNQVNTADNKIEVQVDTALHTGNSHWVHIIDDGTDLNDQKLSDGSKLADHLARGQWGSVTLASGTEYVSAPSGFWVVSGGQAINVNTRAVMSTQDFAADPNNKPPTGSFHVGPPGIFNDTANATFQNTTY